jgi:hypothetical protein
MVRTLSDAAALAEAGYVRLNGQRVGPPVSRYESGIF